MGSCQVSLLFKMTLTWRSLPEINLLGLLHQTLLINHNELRVMVLDTLYVLMSRAAVPVQDASLIAMRREAFSEQSLQGYGQVLDQVFANMATVDNGQLVGVDRDAYGVGKKFVMVPSLVCISMLTYSTYVPLPRAN